MLTELHEHPRPSVSVIIPTYQAGEELRDLLTRLQTQTLRPREIIVIDSSSKDGTPELAESLGARVIRIDQADFDHGGTRNYAASLAVGEVLVFMTQDAMPADEHLLERLSAPLLADERTAHTYARQLPRPDAALLERLARDYNYPPESRRQDRTAIQSLGIKAFFCSNACAAVRREYHRDRGGFASPVIFNEDLFMAADSILAGYAVQYVADACVMHSHNYSLLQHFKRMFDNGVSMRRNASIYAYSGVNKAGSGLVGYQLRELVKGKKRRLIPRLLAESAAKYAGYQLGRRYPMLPNALCRRFSMHRRIWTKLSAESGSTGSTTASS